MKPESIFSDLQPAPSSAYLLPPICSRRHHLPQPLSASFCSFCTTVDTPSHRPPLPPTIFRVSCHTYFFNHRFRNPPPPRTTPPNTTNHSRRHHQNHRRLHHRDLFVDRPPPRIQQWTYLFHLFNCRDLIKKNQQIWQHGTNKAGANKCKWAATCTIYFDGWRPNSNVPGGCLLGETFFVE